MVQIWYNGIVTIFTGCDIMSDLEPKKSALIRILQIFEKYSDFNHPLKQNDIIEILERDYGIIVERKSISRNISLLKELGYEIESTRQGSFLVDRPFEDSELRMLIDGVLSSKHITAKHSKELIEKLCNMSNVYFRSHVKNIYSVNDWNKTDNQALFLNIELIDEAIERKCQLEFDYNKFGVDKKLHKSASHKASPYQLILHNQRYYLMALNEKWHNMGYYRLDRISNMRLNEDEALTDIRTVDGFKKGIDYKQFSSALPYMFTDKHEKIELKAQEKIVDQIVDWFGKDIKITPLDEEYVQVELVASPNAMEFWAMQYMNFVEVVKPVELREKIKTNIEKAQEKYK